ncbi:MAG: CBS domain-containing protein [Candidatus Bathyarchaeia archaeon]
MVAKNLQPDKVTVSEIMSRPLATIDGDTSIREVARRMSRLEIRRLAVVSKKGELEGIITSKDILRITPALLDVLSEKSRLPLPEQLREPTRLAGYCDMCGEWSDALAQRDGQFYCDDCLSDMDEQSRPQ